MSLGGCYQIHSPKHSKGTIKACAWWISAGDSLWIVITACFPSQMYSEYAFGYRGIVQAFLSLDWWRHTQAQEMENLRFHHVDVVWCNGAWTALHSWRDLEGSLGAQCSTLSFCRAPGTLHNPTVGLILRSSLCFWLAWVQLVASSSESNLGDLLRGRGRRAAEPLYCPASAGTKGTTLNLLLVKEINVCLTYVQNYVTVPFKKSPISFFRYRNHLHIL